MKNLAGGDPIQITFGQLPADRPRWSPRNDQIVFTLGSLGRDGASPEWRIESIWSVPPLGGAPRKIIESGGNPNWSGDGSRLVFERGREIWIVGADGSNPRKVEGVPAVGHLIADRMPSLSPDGTLVVFFQPEAGPSGDFWLLPVAGGVARRLTFDVAQGSSPAWTPDGRFVVFSSKRAGSMTLWKVPASGGSVEPVLVSAGEDTDPEISRDGSKLIYTHVRHTYRPDGSGPCLKADPRTQENEGNPGRSLVLSEWRENRVLFPPKRRRCPPLHNRFGWQRSPTFDVGKGRTKHVPALVRGWHVPLLQPVATRAVFEKTPAIRWAQFPTRQWMDLGNAPVRPH